MGGGGGCAGCWGTRLKAWPGTKENAFALSLLMATDRMLQQRESARSAEQEGSSSSRSWQRPSRDHIRILTKFSIACHFRPGHLSESLLVAPAESWSFSALACSLYSADRTFLSSIIPIHTIDHT